jgi:hypothetical protein
LGWGIAVDDNKNGYLIGSTTSDDFPIENPFEAIQPTRGGLSDAFVAKLDVDGDRLVYSTYLGGSRDDVGNSIAVDSTASIYIAGSTVSDDFPVKNPLQVSRGGLSDVFVSRIGEEETPVPTPPDPTDPDNGEEIDCCDIECFIATAAYGSPLERHVLLLREFRDRFLLTSDFGRRLVVIYSTYSPPAAEFVGRHRTVRAVVRWSLLPLVVVSWMVLKVGPTATLMLLMSLVGAIMLFLHRGWRLRVSKGQYL